MHNHFPNRQTNIRRPPALPGTADPTTLRSMEQLGPLAVFLVLQVLELYRRYFDPRVEKDRVAIGIGITV